MSNTSSQEDQHRSDRELVLMYDPYGDREIELKLDIHKNIDSFDLLKNIENNLRNGTFDPYFFDPRGSLKSQIDVYTFACLSQDNTYQESFKVNVIASIDKVSIREKSLPDSIDTIDSSDIESFILDREENIIDISAKTIGEFLLFLKKNRSNKHSHIVYVGNYLREHSFISCINQRSGHGYALVADVCIGEDTDAILKQLEIEYIWKRKPYGRNFTKAEIYKDTAEVAHILMTYYNREGNVVLSPSRVTKFEWLLGQTQTILTQST